VVIATGTEPRALGEWHARIVSGDRWLELASLPPEVLVIGAGTEGAEIVEILTALGVKVTWLMDELGLLPSFDRELAEAVGDVIMERGVKLVHGKAVLSVTASGEQALAKLDGGRTYGAPLAIVAAGRTPDLARLDLAALGASELRVDGFGRTSVAHVLAAGSVTGLSHGIAGSEAFGRVAGRTAAGVDGAPFDPALVPRVASTEPEIGQVGLTPDLVAGREVAIHTIRLEETIGGQLAGIGERAHAKGFVRLVCESDGGRVLGATAIGPGAREIVSAAALAIRLGATDAQLADTFAHAPSALDALVRAVR
jgi:pyruvate/2-oxoglutarate dehydrogenase complex dihydrolipoamide dehydrogenase (E3) component